jgi:MFS family permease
MGLQPDDDKGTPGDIPGRVDRGFSLREALRTRQYWTIFAVNLLALFCLLSVMVHIVPHAQDTGVSVVRAATVLSLIGGVSMAGRFLTGIAIDRIGSKGVMIICLVLLIITLLWLQLADELWMLYLFALVYGIAHGGIFTAISPIVAEFFGISAIGVLFGIVVFGGTVGGAIGPIVAGYIYDVTDGYSLAFWLCTLVSALGLLLMASLKPAGERPGSQFEKADEQTQPVSPAQPSTIAERGRSPVQGDY